MEPIVIIVIKAWLRDDARHFRTKIFPARLFLIYRKKRNWNAISAPEKRSIQNENQITGRIFFHLSHRHRDFPSSVSPPNYRTESSRSGCLRLRLKNGGNQRHFVALKKLEKRKRSIQPVMENGPSEDKLCRVDIRAFLWRPHGDKKNEGKYLVNLCLNNFINFVFSAPYRSKAPVLWEEQCRCCIVSHFATVRP